MYVMHNKAAIIHLPWVPVVCAGVIFVGRVERHFTLDVVEKDTSQRDLPHQLCDATQITKNDVFW